MVFVHVTFLNFGHKVNNIIISLLLISTHLCYIIFSSNFEPGRQDDPLTLRTKQKWIRWINEYVCWSKLAFTGPFHVSKLYAKVEDLDVRDVVLELLTFENPNNIIIRLTLTRPHSVNSPEVLIKKKRNFLKNSDLES